MSARKRSEPGAVLVRSVWARVVLSVVSGAMVFLCYPNFDLFPLEWLAFVPLLAVLDGRGVRAAFGWGTLAGTVTNAGGFWWITGMLMDFGHFPVYVAIPICLLLCAYQGLMVGVWAAIVAWLGRPGGVRRLWLAPVAWVVVEFSMPFIFPWYLANGQYRFYAAIQMVELTGVIGLSFILILVNAALYEALLLASRRDWRAAARPAGLAAGVFAATVIYGVIRIHQVDAAMAAAPKLKIGLGEANVGIFEKEAKGFGALEQIEMLRGNILKHNLLGAELEARGVDLVVEPESSFIPGYELVPTQGGMSATRALVSFKRNDVFGVAVGGSDVATRRDRTWKASKRLRHPDRRLLGVAMAREDLILGVGERGLILRYDGTQWVDEASPATGDLRAVWAGGSDAYDPMVDGEPIVAYAVGDGGQAIVRSSEGSWAASPAGTQVSLRGVAGFGGVWALAAGERGTLLRFAGGRWESERSGTTRTLHAVAVRDKFHAVAVGDGGVVCTLAEGSWTAARVAPVPLRGVVATRSRTVAVGDGGQIWEQPRDGSWRQVRAGGADLRAVTADGRGDLTAVGAGGAVLSLAVGSTTWTVGGVDPAVADLAAVAGSPYTYAHAYARDSRYVGRSFAPLPKVADRIAAVGRVAQPLALDLERVPDTDDWNVPIRGFDTPILLGLLTYEPVEPGVSPLRGRSARRTYNSAMLLAGDGRVLGRYDKNYLLVFGEYIPFGDTFPKLYDWIPEAGRFTAGDRVDVFDFKGFRLGTIICYEDILPRFTRGLTRHDPHVIINVTNDAWFGQTSEPYLHLALAVFRSVENRLWMVRSTNTGVSAFIDAVGRIVSETALDGAEVLVEDVPMLELSTPYRRWGELFTTACFLIFGAWVARRVLQRRRARA